MFVLANAAGLHTYRAQLLPLQQGPAAWLCEAQCHQLHLPPKLVTESPCFHTVLATSWLSQLGLN